MRIRLLQAGLVMLAGFMSFSASALEVGDVGPCVKLPTIPYVAPPAVIAAAVESCITHPEVEDRPILVEFFGSQCSACHTNLPKFSALSQEFAGQATFRQIGIDKDPSLVIQYIEENREYILYSVGLDSARIATKAYEVFATPTLFVLDKDNKIIFKKIGVLSNTDLDQIRSLLRTR